MARRGARVLDEPRDGSASSAWRGAVVRARADEEDPAATEVWIRVDEPDTARSPRRAAATPTGHSATRHTVPAPVVAELAGAAGSGQGAKLAQRLAEASHAYDRDRYQDALRILRPLAGAVPSSAAVRELYGLTLYRMGRWRHALQELEAYQKLTGSYDQHPVRMDCLRALRRYREVEVLWDELRPASPGADVVAEGRIVMAGALADQGRLPAAVKLLERAGTVNKPRQHHLREWYALADIYERAGDLPGARDLFCRIARHDAEAFDVAERLRSLR